MRKIEAAAIIGAGPAGIAAAIQLSRYNIGFRIFEKKSIGGLLNNANLIENYPGFPEGISGTSLVDYFKQQLKKSAIKVGKFDIRKIDYDTDQDFFILSFDKSVFYTHFVIIASGTEPKELPALSSKLNRSKYIFYEVYPLKNIKRKKIAIIGAGDAAFDYSLNLSKGDNEIMIFNRSDSYKCLNILYKRVKKSSNISCFQNFQLHQAEEKQSKLKLIFKNQDKLQIYDVDYLLIAIGRKSALDFMGEKFILKKNSLIKNGLLHFAGDVDNGLYRQTAIAVGEGVKAAMIIADKFKEKDENFSKSW